MTTLAIPSTQVKRKTIWVTPKTGFNDSLGRLFNQSDQCSGYELVKEDRWDDVSIIWKPITPGPNYAKLPRLEFLSTLFTSHQTLTEKLSLLTTGLKAFERTPKEGWSSFFEIQPYSQSSSSSQIQIPQPYLRKYPGFGSANWITKPTGSWGGSGIKIFTTPTEALKSLNHKRDPRIVQKYLEHPLLFKGRKFDIRMHVLLTPDRVLFHRDGFMRVCPKQYTAPTGADVQHDGIHLTNLLQNDTEGEIHLFSDLDVDRQTIYKFLQTMAPLFRHAQEVERKYHLDNGIMFRTFELLGIDIIFDQDRKPWLLEVNKDPATPPEGAVEELMVNLMKDTLKEAIFFELDPSLREPTGFTLL